jgi:histone H3/H4
MSPKPADQPPPDRPLTVARQGRRKAKRVFAIPKVSFRRLVEEIARDCKSDLRFQATAIEALQESAEEMMTERFARCSELVDLCKLDTVRQEHWRFVQEGKAVPCSGKS